MTFRFHHLVQTDVFDAVDYYKSVSGKKLAYEFFDELNRAFVEASANPLHHHFDLTAGCRRVNLNRFPYHFLHDTHAEFIFIFVVRHDKRHPSFGLKRKR